MTGSLRHIGRLPLVVAAAVAGSAARWAVLTLLPADPPLAWPLVLVNAAGCGLIGWALDRIRTEPAVAAMTLGFCGAFTSASTFAVAVAVRLDDGEVAAGSALVAVTVLTAGLAFAAGHRIATR